MTGRPVFDQVTATTRLPAGISSRMALASAWSGMRARCASVFTDAARAVPTARGLSQRDSANDAPAIGAAATVKTQKNGGKRSKMNHVAMKTLGMTQ